MQFCIFCRSEFDSSPREHVIHAFLGARWYVPDLICADCQSTFATVIDKPLAAQLQPFRVLLGTEGDHGGTGPGLRNLPSSSGESVHLGPQGRPVLARPIVTETPEGEQKRIRIRVGRIEDLAWAVSDLRKRYPDIKFDLEELQRLAVVSKEPIAGTLKIETTLGERESLRAIAKSCANLFAAHDASARVIFGSKPFNAVREFIHHGTGHPSVFVRWLVSETELTLPTRGLADQSIFLTTRGKNIEGVIRFFGHFSYAVRLASDYSGPPIRCAYLVDPFRKAEPAELRLAGDILTQHDGSLPSFEKQAPVTDAAVEAAWAAMVTRFLTYHTKCAIVNLARETAADIVAMYSKNGTVLPQDEVDRIVDRIVQQKLELIAREGIGSKVSVKAI